MLTSQEFDDNLPEEYLIPKKKRQSRRWIDNLVWETGDSFYTASDKITARLEQIRSSRGQWYAFRDTAMELEMRYAIEPRRRLMQTRGLGSDF